jgi:uncharacterized protein YbcI
VAVDVKLGNGALLAITNDVSSLMRRFYGKGPARSRAFVNGDLLFLVLEDVLTEFEQTFIAKGDSSTVRLIRTRYQELINDEMVSIVERHCDRRVADYMSQILTNAGMLIEIFQLAPRRG